jgi:predicted nucleic acid-binding Zn ribbon protein
VSDHEPRLRGGAPAHIGDVLNRALDRIGPKTLWVEVKLRKLWPAVVGDDVAPHAQVLRLRGTTLLVGVTSDTWGTELRYLSRVVIEKLNARLGEGTVTEVVVVRSRNRTGA